MIDIKTRELAILVIGPFNDPFDYILEDSSTNIAIGQIVEVPFGRKKTIGVVVGKGTGKVPGEKLKKINKIFEINCLSKECIEFINFLASWNCVFKGLVLKMILSPLEAITSPNTFKIYKANFKRIKNIEKEKSFNLTPKKKLVIDFLLNADRNINKDELTKACKVSEALLRDMVKKNIIREEFIKKLPTPELKNALKVSKYEKNKKLLNSHQLSAVKKINDSIKGNKSECFLLDGVPGSGKTETYFESVKASLDEGKQVLILLP
jgi:primosomal protein N' (replication factor Y)